MADPDCSDADPDPTFHADADPDPKLFRLKGNKKFPSKSSPIRSKIVPNLSCVIFSVIMRQEGSGVRAKG